MQNAFCEHPLLKSWAPGQRGRSKPGSTKWRKKYCCYNQLNVICTKAMLLELPSFWPLLALCLVVSLLLWVAAGIYMGSGHDTWFPITFNGHTSGHREPAVVQKLFSSHSVPSSLSDSKAKLVHYISSLSLHHSFWTFHSSFFLMKLKSRNFKCL